jgi:hypothetical protein
MILHRGIAMAGQPLSTLRAGAADPTSKHRLKLENNQPKGRAGPGTANIIGLTCIRCDASYPTTIVIDCLAR